MSVPATRFVLLRHGEAAGNRELRYLGSTDAALTERGRAQAEQLAAALPPFGVSALYTSPLARARATAEAAAAVLGVPVREQRDLREQDFGAWENLTRAEVLARDAERLTAWEAGDDVAPPNGESLAVVGARMVALVNTLAARHPDETVALVSHVGPIKALACAALELPPAGALRMWLDPASICVVEWRRRGDGQPQGILRVFNAIAHLDPPVRWLAR